MKHKLTIIVGLSALAIFSATTVRAVPVTGNIGFSGSAQLNSTSVQSATEVVSWLQNTVGSSSGSFASIAPGTLVQLSAPWMFNSGPLNNFWKVGGFTFNLVSSVVYSQTANFLDVILDGTVSGNGYSTTDFTGSFQVANPSANGMTVFTERMSFTNAVPDGGSSVMLLGLTCFGLGLIHRQYNNFTPRQ